MKKIESILGSGNVFFVDEIVCLQHAQIIKTYERPIEIFEWSSKPKYLQLAFKVAFISICHQFNWDFMQETLSSHLLENEVNFIDTIEKITAPTLSSWLKMYPKQERVRAKERAEILRDVGKVLRHKFKGDLKYFYECCKNAPLKNGELHKLLDNFLGYRTDPLRKKTNVLTHDLLKENILSFEDESNIEPAIDYHIMRLYVRSGRVVPSDKLVLNYLKGKPNPRGTLVRKLRESVSQAEKLMAHYSGLNVADVNYIEWQIGRSICLNINPICQEDEKVIILPNDVLSLSNGDCPYRDVCTAVNLDTSMIDIEEPVYISTNY